MYNQQNIQSALSKIENEQIRTQFPRAGFYRALVVSNEDPTNLGRVKIRIPALHGTDSNQLSYVPDTTLPYAYPGALSGAGYQEGQYLLPSVGHIVWVSFETGTENYIYFGGIFGEEPEGDRYIYMGRGVNNGLPVRVIGDDIPNDYHPSKHILYRGINGDIIYIDDRDNTNAMVIQNRHGNSITLNSRGINIRTDNPLSANFPYLHIFYVDASKVKSHVEQFEVALTDISDGYKLDVESASPTVGSIIIYTSNGEVKGSGVITTIDSNNAYINTISVTGSGGSGGTTNYIDLYNKPSLNSVILQGNRDVAENPLTNQQIESLLK